MGSSTAGGKNIATTKSGHAAPGPPAISAGPAPPPPPAPPTGPWIPAPFMYIARSQKAQEGSCSESNATDDGGRCLINKSAIDIEQPGNMPSTPSKNVAANQQDCVSRAIVGIGYVQVPNNSDTLMKGENVAVTGATIFLNLPGPSQKPHQSESALLEGAGLLAAANDPKANPCVVIATGDPVAVVSGDVVDGADDLYSPGVIDVVFGRTYASSRKDERGALGAGWLHSFEQWIEIDGDTTVVHASGGVRVVFPAIAPGESAWSRTRGMELRRTRAGYELWARDTRQTRDFAPLAPEGQAVLRCVRDTWGNRIELVYDAGRLASVLDTAKRQLRFHYAAGRLSRVELWARGKLQQSVSYEYDVSGDLSVVTDALGQQQRYAYDAKHRLASKQLKNGTVFHYTYDKESDRCVRSRAAGDLLNVELSFDVKKGVTTVHGNPQPVIYTYNEKGDLLSESSLDRSSLFRYEYDADQLLVATENAAGHRWENTFDERGNLIEKKLPGGRSSRFVWENDCLVSATHAGGRVTRMTYDDRGALVSVTSPGGRRRLFSYDERGRTTGEFDANGQTCALEWDEEHNLVAFRDARGATFRYTYDAMGRLTSRVDPVGRVLRQDHDALGRIVRTTMPDGTALDYTYVADEVVTSQDTAGIRIESEYSGTGRVVRRRSSSGEIWQFKYDVLERLREVKNPKEEVYSYRYDRSGRTVEEQTFDGQRIRYSYGKHDLLSRIEFEDGTFVEFEYDDARLLVSRASSHAVTRIEWDEAGFPIKETLKEHDGVTVTESTWDPDGFLLSETIGGRTVRFTYDAVGNVASRTLPNGQVTRYHHDENHALSGLEHEGERVYFSRDALGREERRYVYGSGLDLRWVYDESSRPTQLHALIGGAPVVQRRWEYGPHARLAAAHDSRWGTTRYRHDVGGRLRAAETAWGAEVFDYDPAGSIVAMGEGRERWAMLPGNVLERAGEARFESDVRGRRTRKHGPDGVTEYAWDCTGQLREATLPTGAVVRFWYDTQGRRRRKTVLTPPPDDQPLGEPGLREVTYVWDADELAMEIDSERGERVFVHKPSTFVPVLQCEGGRTLAYVTDPLGQPRELVDPAGRVVWSARTSAFGRVEATAPEAPDTSSPFRLLGHYWDEETGLFYARNRYFDPDTARWLSPDPLGLDGGTNLFALCGSPTERTDPLGLSTATEFQKWLEATHAGRIQANAIANAKQQQVKEACDAYNARRVEAGKQPGNWYAQKTAAAKVDANGNVTVAMNGGKPNGQREERPWGNADQQGKPLHAEEKTNVGQGDYSGAGRPHCGNCTDHVMQQGGVTSSPIQGTGPTAWNPQPTPDNAGNATWDPPAGGSPLVSPRRHDHRQPFRRARRGCRAHRRARACGAARRDEPSPLPAAGVADAALGRAVGNHVGRVARRHDGPRVGSDGALAGADRPRRRGSCRCRDAVRRDRRAVQGGDGDVRGGVPRCAAGAEPRLAREAAQGRAGRGARRRGQARRVVRHRDVPVGLSGDDEAPRRAGDLRAPPAASRGVDPGVAGRGRAPRGREGAGAGRGGVSRERPREPGSVAGGDVVRRAPGAVVDGGPHRGPDGGARGARRSRHGSPDRLADQAARRCEGQGDRSAARADRPRAARARARYRCGVGAGRAQGPDRPRGARRAHRRE